MITPDDDKSSAMSFPPSHFITLGLSNLSIFSEPNPSLRLSAMASTYSPSIVFHEPPSSPSALSSQYVGYAAISAVIDKLLAENQGWAFQPVGRIWCSPSGKLARLAWGFGPRVGGVKLDGEVDIKLRGEDVLVVDGYGKVCELHVLIEGVSDVAVDAVAEGKV
jgi:hypothetical protein